MLCWMIVKIYKILIFIRTGCYLIFRVQFFPMSTHLVVTWIYNHARSIPPGCYVFFAYIFVYNEHCCYDNTFETVKIPLKDINPRWLFYCHFFLYCGVKKSNNNNCKLHPKPDPCTGFCHCWQFLFPMLVISK